MTANNIKHADNFHAEKNFILTEAGRCVACGLCLPHCPTYQLTSVEAESPRGRIALISALASDELAASETLETLLHNCLLCRACENMCPSSVSFSVLMDKSRHLHKLLQKDKPVRKLTANKLIYHLSQHPEWLRVAGNIISPFSILIKKILNTKNSQPVKRNFSDYLASIKPHSRWKNKYPAANSEKQVSLFLGCIARSVDGETLDDAIYVLNRMGYSVIIPDNQVCCGALSLHAGLEKDSLAMMKQNFLAFDEKDTVPIIFTASGCGQVLGKYDDYLAEHGFVSRINEICQFIDAHWPEDINISGPPQKVFLHTPCSLENVSFKSSAAYRLLCRFKNVNLKYLGSDYHCCGASGTKMIDDVSRSNALRDPLMTQIKSERPDVVASSNIGCALHLQEGLRQVHLNIPVKHPVSLVAEMMRND